MALLDMSSAEILSELQDRAYTAYKMSKGNKDVISKDEFCTTLFLDDNYMLSLLGDIYIEYHGAYIEKRKREGYKITADTSFSANVRNELRYMISQLENKEKKSVTDIVCLRLFCKMLENNTMPWHKDFCSPCINFVSQKEYRGVNRFLLDSGEYITFKQLLDYNKKHGTNFRLSQIEDTDDELIKRAKRGYTVIYYDIKERKLSPTSPQALAYKRGDKPFGVSVNSNGDFIYTQVIFRYYRVFNTSYIFDNDIPFPKVMGNDIVFYNIDANKVIDTYFKMTGVQLRFGGNGCSYNQATDTIELVDKQYFDDAAAYYRSIFHEMVHSTGLKSRLNRKCFEEYHEDNFIRGAEECVAELGATLLAIETGIEAGSDNSDAYVLSWLRWMYNNPSLLLKSMNMADAAKNYILSWADGIDTSDIELDSQSDDMSE